MVVIDGKKHNLRSLFFYILKPDSQFYSVIIIYGIAVSLLTLAVPISVQALIGSVINLSLLQPIVVLTIVLLFILAFSAILNALQAYIMENFERKFFARITKELVLRNIYANFSFYEKINRSEIINRYFEVFNIQKDLSFILISTFALVLQSIVGIMVVSFYHPFLLAFNIVVIMACYIVWKIWGRLAIDYSLENSKSKYIVVRWLEDLARANAFFKSDKTIRHAINKSEELTKNYIRTRSDFFVANFKQKIAFFVIYALSSALLLIIGGQLVVLGQLTTGQLVAAELILSTILYGISKFGYHLEVFYRLCASIEEVANLFIIPIEEDNGEREISASNYNLSFKEVKCKFNDEDIFLNLNIKSNSKTMIFAQEFSLEKAFIHLLKSYKKLKSGDILLGENSLQEYKLENLRQNIISIDTSVIIEGSIDDYLKIAGEKISDSKINEALKIVGLEKTINSLPDKLETILTPSGSPLSENEILKLKLAWAILSKPKILIINSLFDKIAYFERKKLIEYICSIPDLTFIYFSNRKDLSFFEEYFYLQNGRVDIFKNVEKFREFEESLINKTIPDTYYEK